ncbi:two-component system sensor histidine kinase PhoQ [Chitinivorax tropicus]|uniref:histidine kinase n=1 Tax=Chitinivorax tropicus TaxID=714531 RepID=A0A840MN51_9PROT|nr:ATP-binding protein [Chitinivorax tropicus]MBB5018397.1 two-component system sensor histidine kinase PhoQ [Chitinivorax tropicus]
MTRRTPLMRVLMSIRARVAVSAALVLLVFVALTAAALDRAFRESALEARRERLLGQLYVLMAAAELNPSGQVVMPSALNEPRFGLPGSGLYANIADLNAHSEWQSNSTIGLDVPFERVLTPGEQRFSEMRDRLGRPYFVLGFGVKWQVGRKHIVLTFSVSEDEQAFLNQIQQYRHALWGWLGGMALLLIVTQFFVLRWGLQPLRRVVRELREVESGQRDHLAEDYPDELIGLTRNLNDMLGRERAQQQRYRDALGDLAHSLKTPLAVLRNAVADNDPAMDKTVTEQLGRMDQIVQYQLQRASTAGSSTLQPPIALRPDVDKIVSSLNKVYADKGVQIQVEVAASLQARIDQGDLYELVGNLLDNACKFSQGRVSLSMSTTPKRLTIQIEDDGPGVADADAIFARGGRADERAPGHGLGLALVKDIVTAYGGALDVSRSQSLGGACFTVILNSAAGH